MCAALTATIFVAACGPADTDPGEGGVTVGEARALDEAAEMVEAGRLDPAVVGNAPEQGSVETNHDATNPDPEATPEELAP
ncbi:hypothetical protein HME9302_00044 [Alteripontixanthobacter maritimus]|nr:hypothetical protein [Alteripontixanthobacter maritimus]RDC58869.1 hypothetical protein HME9302_00044 [Alteripontixanthobacter maritimus]